MSHTPGPWVAVADGIVSGKTGQVVCVFTRGFPGDRSECAANERLIRTAPDLLAAAKRLMNASGILEYSAAMDQLETAVKKAGRP